jgi:N-acetylmuramoyl-L-alanine amidase
MKWVAAFAMSASLLAAQAGHEPLRAVTGVRHWSLTDATRVAVEVSGAFTFRTARLHNPDRIYFDILNARPHFSERAGYLETLDDALLSRIRVAENQPGVTRVVLDLAEGTAVTTSQLVNPDRLMIELRPAATKPAPTAPEEKAIPARTVTKTLTPADATVPPKLIPRPPLPQLTVSPMAGVARPADQQAPEPPKQPLPKPSANPDAAPSTTAMADAAVKTLPPNRGPSVDAATPSKTAPAAPVEIAKAARPTSEGDSSLVRALGLKLTRVVIDPGHGGHDQGTAGPHGLLEKDVVLDVAQRLGKLIEDRMGAEVIYTRDDDTFIPLQARTALANEKKADLFLSIHANSSPVPPVAGIETFYLSMKGTKYAMDVASRENASFEKSVFDLPELVAQIAKNDKAAESKEFAERIQAALYAFSAHNVPGSKDRGIKSAPFVVLIGAHMPSVLAEIGFLTNAKEETLLKKPDYRQKLAEALYKGVSRYADSLSHFQASPAPAPVVTKAAAHTTAPAQ